MLKSFLKIAIRYLLRNKTYSILNFTCLTFGLCCAIFALLYILNILSYDKFHKNYNRLHSVEAYVTYFNGDRFPKEYLSASLTDVLKEQAPEIEDMTRITKREYSFNCDDITFTENGFYADSNFFEIFTFPVVRAVSKNILTDPNSIVISERVALKFFESIDCLDKILIMNDENISKAFKVAGVFRDIPRQSLMQFDFVIPFSKFLADNQWAIETGSSSNETWILLKNNADRNLIENKIKNLIKNQETTLNQELFIFPLKEHILYSYASGKRVWKEMQKIVITGTTGFTILLIACFNFINLAIALNFGRYKEVGIRKVSGSGKSAIVIQFLGETFIITLMSLFCALILVRILLTGFNNILNYDIHMHLLDIKTVAFIIMVTLFTGLSSGLLPAFYLASSSPVDTLKGIKITGHKSGKFRQGLIIFQFAIPIVLIICMMVIKSQDRYMRNYDVGLDKDRVFILDNSINIQKHGESLKAELMAIPGIDAVSFTNCIPTRGARVSSEVNWEGKDVSEKLHFWCISSDFDYNKVVNVNIVKGRFFDPSFSTDSVAYLINDIAADVMDNNNPVGSTITLDGIRGNIIGVFKDFHSIDLAGPLVPAIMRIKPDDQPIILIKYSSGSVPEIISQIEAVYKNYNKEVLPKVTLFQDLVPFSDLNLPSNLVGLSFIIALFLACMGLYGLASFTSENRTKEIGIRKANGASTLSVTSLLLASYTKWLVIAIVIALPIALLLCKNFLERFNFHSPMPYWAFLAGPAIAFFVALLTVSAKTWSVASRNPVKALRFE